MSKITNLIVRPIINSKANFTIQAIAFTDSQATLRASIPAGTSTGSKEAKYVDINKAIEIILTKINTSFLDYVNQQKSLKDWHEFLKTLDNTVAKEKIGANTFLVMEELYIKCLAYLKNQSTYKTINQEAQKIIGNFAKINKVTPLFNIINGGVHANTTLPFQEFWAIPTGLKTISEKISAGVTIYQNLKKILNAKNYLTLTGLEGGFAPNLPGGIKEALDLIMEAIYKSGFRPGKEITLGMDAAANSFALPKDNEFLYKLYPGKEPISHTEYVKFWEDITANYPIILVEDPLHEQTPLSIWAEFLDMLSLNVIDLIGDDLTVTNPQIIKNALQHKAISGSIIKPNQIGSIVEALESFRVLSDNNAISIVSHRSGETNDDFIADLSIGIGTNYIKAGAPAHGERVAKYNRMLEIALELGL